MVCLSVLGSCAVGLGRGCDRLIRGIENWVSSEILFGGENGDGCGGVDVRVLELRSPFLNRNI